MARKPRSMAKTGSELVAASQERQRAAGGGRFPSITLAPDEKALWDALVVRHGGDEHGAAKRTLMASLRALDARAEPSNAELIAMLEARLPKDGAKLARGVKVSG
jgi:hypothetical protein